MRDKKQLCMQRAPTWGGGHGSGRPVAFAGTGRSTNCGGLANAKDLQTIKNYQIRIFIKCPHYPEGAVCCG